MAYQRKLANEPLCPFEHLLQIIGGKWKSRVLCLLHNLGTMRFGEIRAGLGSISDAVLAGVLQDLQMEGIVQRELYGEVPPRVEYTLTEKGESLIPILRSICTWAQANRTFEADHLLEPCQKCEQFHVETHN